MGRSLADQLWGARVERALSALLYDAAARARPRAGAGIDPRLAQLDPEELEHVAAGIRRMVRERAHRGSGGPRDWFPRTLAAWRKANPSDQDHDQLLGQFCASRACRAWHEGPAGRTGISLEEAFYRFFTQAAVGDPAVREHEFLGALVRSLAITPRARFSWPGALRRAPGGCYALTRDRVLHAAIDGRYLCGPVTPLVAALLLGALPPAIAPEPAAAVLARLRDMRLVA